MKVLKSLLVFAFILGFAFAQDAPTIGLININFQALFFNQINDGATKAAEDLGVDLQIVDGANDPAKQVQAVETFITQQVSAIIVVAIDVEGIKPAVQAAKDAGIPVVAIDAKVEVPPADAFIGVDNYGAGVQAGEWLVNYVNENMDGTATVGIVGALNSFIQNQRRDGFVEALAVAPGITVSETVDGQNVQEVALTAAENLVTANPDMNIIYATGEPALIGVVAAVEAQGLQDRIQVIGWDLTKQSIDGMDAGYVKAVVQQDPYQEGYAAVETLLKLIAGEAVEEEVLIPIAIVTPENLADFRGLFE
jgi:ribose transport system substrate-binding protein